MYIQTCSFADNNKHVDQERTVRLSMININIYCNLICIEKILFTIDLNVFTVKTTLYVLEYCSKLVH